MSLSGQIALVTGASSGIGRAVALELARLGAIPCLVGRHSGRLNAVAKTIEGLTPNLAIYQADLTLDSDLRRLRNSIESDFGRLHLLIQAAGVIALGEIQEASIKDLDWQYQSNLRAPYYLTQFLLPMLKAQQGQVAFINSSAGLRARATLSQYAATKQALKAVADSLRDEVNTHGVRVLSLFLGRTASPMQAAVHEREGRSYQPNLLMQAEDVASMLVAALALPRTAEVTEISMRPMIKL